MAIAVVMADAVFPGRLMDYDVAASVVQSVTVLREILLELPPCYCRLAHAGTASMMVRLKMLFLLGLKAGVRSSGHFP